MKQLQSQLEWLESQLYDAKEMIAKKDEELAAANETIISAIKAFKMQNLPLSEIAKIFKVSIEMVESIK